MLTRKRPLSTRPFANKGLGVLTNLWFRNDHDSAQKTKDFATDYFSSGPDISWFADVLKKHADAQFLANEKK